MSGRIVLCADDYGLSDSVSRAILDLAQRGRLSAISCMTGTPHWREHGKWLAEFKDKVDIGLHLTLADDRPITSMPHLAPNGQLPGIGAMILKAYRGQLDLAEIGTEVRAQLDAFTAVTGFAPAHIDGHLHTHILPGVRDVVARLAQSVTPTPWVRNVYDDPVAILRRGVAVPKTLLIAGLGHALAGHPGLKSRMNDSFSGIYAFSTERRNYGGLFGRFMRARGRTHLIQCHPGGVPEAGDPIGENRAAEYKFFGGAAFPEYLAREKIALTRFGDGRFAEANG